MPCKAENYFDFVLRADVSCILALEIFKFTSEVKPH